MVQYFLLPFSFLHVLAPQAHVLPLRFVRLGEPRIVHVLLLGQVQLGVLHAGPLVHVLCLVQLRLCVAQAGLVHARGHVPQFSRS